MASELHAGWKTMPLEDWMAAIIDYRGKTPEKTSSGIPLITAKIVKGGRIEAPEEFIAEDAYEQWMRRGIPEAGDVVLTTEAPLGEVAQLDGRKVALAQRIITLRGKPELLDNTYLKVALQSQPIQEQLHGRASGSTVTGIKQSELRKLQLTFPSLEEQRRVAGILGSVDDKIDLNRRINQTLEAMAQAIFKSWFVDFDPVKAKIAALAEDRDPLRAAISVISGKPDAELDALPPEQYKQLAATAAVFPDEMEESELGRIPKGWEASQVGKITSRVAMGPFGSDIKKESFVETGVPVIRGGNLTDGLVERNYVFVTSKKADDLKNSNAFPGDIVITHRGTLGQVGLIPQRSKFPRYVVSQSQMLLSVNTGRMSPRYLFEFLRSENGKRLLLSNTSQVGVPAIARPTGSVKAIPLVVPDKAVLEVYDNVLAPLLAELSHITKSSETLAELRDALLPKLLSGQLPVEALAEQAGIA